MSKKNHREDYDPRVFQGIAHRGLHGNGITENGLKAFQMAVDNDMAFELDVHLSKDGVLYVCHDDSLLRTTGKEGIIEELTSKEIEEYRLLDGEKVPLFQEVLGLNQERVPIVVELKVHKGNYKPLRKALMKALEGIKNSKSIVLISFDPRALLHCSKRFVTQLLVCKEHDWMFKLNGLYDALDLDQALLERKEVLSYRKKGGIVNAWTIQTEEELKRAKNCSDMVTFQFIDPSRVREILSKR